MEEVSSIVEAFRKASIERLFLTPTFRGTFPNWLPTINRLTHARTPRQIFDLGDHLAEIFRTTRTSGRGQSVVSSGGTVWEALICWYLNLCLVGRRTVVIKHHRKLIPQPVSDAITVNYHNFASNTESDLIAITFPDAVEYSSNKDMINIRDDHGQSVEVRGRGDRYNLLLF